MATEFKLPELGENVSAGDVMRVLVKPGDSVANEQPVLELETDKATIEVPSSVSGTVGEVKVKPGEKVKVGQTIFTLKDSAASGNGTQAKATKDEAQPLDAAAEGGQAQRASVNKEQPAAGAEEAAADRQGDKPGTADEQPRAQRAPQRLPEDEVEEAPFDKRAGQKRGEVVDISRGPRSQSGAQAPSDAPAPPAAPSVRRIARELGVDIRQVSGTGPGGRITVEDVQGFVRAALSSGATPSAPAGACGKNSFT